MRTTVTRRVAAGAVAIGASLAMAGGGATALAQENDNDTGSLTINGSGVHTDSLAAPTYSAATDPLDFSMWELCDLDVFPYGGPTGTAGPFGNCVEVLVRGGEMNIGGLEVPILNGSLRVTGQEIPELAPPTNFPSGENSFTGAPETPNGYGVDHRDLPIPGGALGSADVINLTSVNASVEAVGTPALNTLGGEIDLPIRVKLENPLLGNDCYLGSQQAPIMLNIRTDEFGALGAISELYGEGVPGGYVLDNVGSAHDFAVPAAQGCGLWGSLNWLVNLRANTPSPEGDNSINVEYDAFTATPAAVRSWRDAQG